MSGSDQEKIRRTVERVARESYGRQVAYFPARTKDFWRRRARRGRAERGFVQGAVCLARKARLKILRLGCSPARDSFIDFFCHQRVVLASEPNLLLLTQTQRRPLERTFPERLKLLFVCAHPAIHAALHTLLMLQTVLGIAAVGIAALS